MSNHPMQPIIVDASGTIRFQENKIVRFLLDNGIYDLNKLWIMFHNSKIFSLDDMEQFYQLIGYSVSGFGDISNFRDETISKADELASKLYKQRCKWIMIRCPACGSDNWVDGNTYRLGGACLKCHACSESTMVSKDDSIVNLISLRGFAKPE